MTDTLTPKKRSWTMSRVRSKNTKPEVLVRSILHRLGIRFRLNGKGFSGNPDIVLKKYKTVIFVNGCFWHRHKNCGKGALPKTNTEFWRNKLNRNVSRDKINLANIAASGWNAVVVWECELKDKEKLAERLRLEIKHES
jgi:DNA mismatch endonuclease (patch repair protein)